jgi:hypothetical protein
MMCGRGEAALIMGSGNGRVEEGKGEKMGRMTRTGSQAGRAL